MYIVEDDILVDLDINKKNDFLYFYDILLRVIYLKSYLKIIMFGLRVVVFILFDLFINNFLEYKKWIDMNSLILF